MERKWGLVKMCKDSILGKLWNKNISDLNFTPVVFRLVSLSSPRRLPGNFRLILLAVELTDWVIHIDCIWRMDSTMVISSVGMNHEVSSLVFWPQPCWPFSTRPHLNGRIEWSYQQPVFIDIMAVVHIPKYLLMRAKWQINKIQKNQHSKLCYFLIIPLKYSRMNQRHKHGREVQLTGLN